MLRSMYSGISGMKVNQSKLDVTGNNIANVGTTAFKGSRVRFQDMLSQNMSEAIGPGRNQGGVNGKQVGLGVQIAGIDTLMGQGMMQPTGRNLDVAMDGEGYLVIARGAVPEGNGGGVQVDSNTHVMGNGNGMQTSFTRDGALTLDHSGNLLTSDGYRVLGYPITVKDENGYNTGDESIDYSANGACNFIDVDNKNGVKSRDTLVPLRVPEAVHVRATKIPEKDAAGKDATIQMGYIGIGKIEGIAPAITQSKIHTGDKEFKGEQDLRIGIKSVEIPPAVGGGAATKEWHVCINGVDTKKKPGDVTIKDVATILKLDLAKDADKEKCKKLLGSSTDGDVICNVTEPANVPAGEESKYEWSFTLDAEGMKKVTSFSVEKDGVIKATLDDGKVTALGQIATASFNNTAGLKKMGKNMYQNTSNSGQPNIRSGIGAQKATDNSDSYGDMLQGVLEMANVDLAEQFTDMIVASRAFQASGKMISTGDEILQDIINLKR